MAKTYDDNSIFFVFFKAIFVIQISIFT